MSVTMSNTKAEIFAAYEIETGALTQAADHARELSADLVRWKERTAIFEIRLASIAEVLSWVPHDVPSPRRAPSSQNADEARVIAQRTIAEQLRKASA